METTKIIIIYAVIFGTLLATVTAILSVWKDKKSLVFGTLISVAVIFFLYYDSESKEWLESLVPSSPVVPIRSINIVGNYIGKISASSRLDHIKAGSYKLIITKIPDRYWFELESIYYNDSPLSGQLIKEDNILYFNGLGEAIFDEVGSKIFIRSISNQQQYYEFEFSK